MQYFPLNSNKTKNIDRILFFFEDGVYACIGSVCGVVWILLGVFVYLLCVLGASSCLFLGMRDLNSVGRAALGPGHVSGAMGTLVSN